MTSRPVASPNLEGAQENGGFAQGALSVAWLRSITDAVAQGIAFFFGLFSLANSVAWLRNGMHHEDIWWIDLSWLPLWLGVAFGIAAALLLLTWGVVPGASRWRRIAVTSACVLLAAAASINAVAYYRVWSAGRITPAMPLPASVLYAVAFLWIASKAWRWPQTQRSSHPAAVAIVFAACMFAFPLVQMVFFGTTDYRRPADVAVVLGARVLSNGVLSTALEDRVRTGADLYNAGLVSGLVMSGGIGESGVDETVAMQRRAVELGVPKDAIVLDNLGVNTDATVAQTTVIFGDRRVRRVLAVSQSWHLPRVKLAYLKSGWNVHTVPATPSIPITQTPYLMLREIPAFWKYWMLSL